MYALTRVKLCVLSQGVDLSQITHKDIAEKLNVSRVTVTRALLDDPQISDQTRIKIKSLADELGYVPNFIGRNLASKRSQLIGLSLPKVDHSFFSNVIEVIYKSCIEAGFGVIPMISFENHANEVENLKTLLSMRVDGIIANIAYDTKDTEIYELVQSRNVPIVFFDRIIDNEAFGSISIHDEDAAYQAVSYAIQCGYEKFAHIAGFSQINIGHDRSKGFKKALHEETTKLKKNK